MPEVSVVIPAYNAEAYLTDAVESALTQSFPDREIVIVDDGSTDGTPAVAARFGAAIRMLRQANAGVSAARNLGAAASQARYLAFLDADDVWRPEKLASQLALLRAQSGARVCYTAFSMADETLRPLKSDWAAAPDVDLETLLVRGNLVSAGSSTVLCERQLFLEVGGFDRTLSLCADWDMWIRLCAASRLAFVNEPLMMYRRHATNMSLDVEVLESDSLRVLEKGFSMSGLTPALLERRDEAFGRNYMVLAGSYFHAGRYADFVRCVRRSLALDPGQSRHLFGYPARVIGRLLRSNRSRD